MTCIERPTRTLESTRLFADERGFFRVRRAGLSAREPLTAFTVEAGPQWTDAQARAEARRMLDVLADGRPTEDHADPLEFAQRNGLLLMIGPAEERYLRPMFARMPREMASAWRTALRGGGVVEVFGAVREAEGFDEALVDADLEAGGSRRRRLTIRSAIAAGVVLVLVMVVLALRGGGNDNALGSIRFEALAEVQGPESREGPPPQVEKSLLARVDRPVAVRTGTGDVQDRIVLDPPPTDLPQPPNAVAATLFRYNGRGQVVLVGPAGWLRSGCIQVSVISPGLRPFDTSYYEAAPGACGGKTFGRVAKVGCLGDDTVMLDLVIPEGEVGLAEGGTAGVGAVRVLLVGNAPGYEKISLNGQVSVASGTEVKVPTFGGDAGATVRFDVSPPTGAPVFGSCVLR
ncbi:MAG TPA: hypothetical protein VGQ20_03095 [Acidimicrobiales bacterium]|nr:hypothetical protein [Acidimicrobiales bacterium]